MKPTISSAHNPRIKAALRLRDSGERRKTGLFLIDGMRESMRALDAGIVFKEVFINRETLESSASPTPARERVFQLIQRIPAEVLQPVETTILDKLSYGQRSSEFVCVAQAPSLEIGRLNFPMDALILVIDAIEKPGNLGAILRTADAVGVGGVILNNPVCDIFNPNAIRASLGTIFTVPLAVARTPETLATLKKINCRIFATQVSATQAFWEMDYCGPVAIVMGSEAHGLRDDWLIPDCVPISIPMFGKADSLNLSTSTAIVLYEAIRQRRRMFDQAEKAV